MRPLRARRATSSYHSSIDTLTFLFTDIEGSTALVRRVGPDVYGDIMEHHNRLVRRALLDHGGEEQGVRGDSFFAVFTSPSAGVAAALAIQRSLSQSVWPRDEHVRVRMGIHAGEVSATSSGLIGYEIHKAARIADVGYGGQILLSSSAAGLVEDWLDDGVALRSLGAHRLKDLGRAETIFQLVADDLRSDFAPLRSLDSPDMPNNLPASLSPFVGRVEEVADVKSIVQSSRMVTLTGAGGSGKTRLALQAAAELLDGSGEGVWLVELAQLDNGSRVPLAILDALHVIADGGDSSAESLVSVLKDQNLLLVLDNCEHLLEDVSRLVDLVGRRCPRVHLLATSREPLGVDGEEIYRVRSLSVPDDDADTVDAVSRSDAARLFTARAQSFDKTFELVDENANFVASICRRLDGIPLALELAAARLSTMALADVHERLDQRFSLLTGGSRNALPRQQTLAATVAWSYDLLSDSERAVLRRLAVFVDGFDLEAVESVCAGGVVAVEEIADIVGSLVAKSLLDADRGPTRLRYRLLETIRQFAADHLLEVEGERAVRELRSRHAECFLERGESMAPRLLHGPTKTQLLRQVDADWGNYSAALENLASDPGGSPRALRLGVAIAPYFHARYQLGPAGLMASELERYLARDLVRARALFWVSMLGPNLVAVPQPHVIRRRETMSEALELARSLGDPELESAALAVLARITSAAHGGAKQRALDLADDALRIAKAGDLAWCTGLALLYKGYVECFHDSTHSSSPLSPNVAGVPAIEESVEWFRRAQDPVFLCRALQQLSLASEGDPVSSHRRELKEQSLRVAEEVGDTLFIFYTASDLSYYAFVDGDVELAETYARRSLMLSRRLGLPSWHSTFTVNNLACCAAAASDFSRAARLLGGVMTLDSLMPEHSYLWSESERRAHANAAAASRAALGDQAYERLLSEGRAMSNEALVSLALRRTPVDA